MRRQSLKRIIARQPKGHTYYRPRHVSVQAYSSSPRRTNTDEDQEVVEMGSRETGSCSDTFNQASEGKNKGFPDSSRSDRSVKTHGHNNPKVDSRPVETENEKGSASSQRQLEGIKKEAGMVLKEDPKTGEGFWKYEYGEKTDPRWELEKARTGFLSDEEGEFAAGLSSMKEHPDAESFPFSKEVPLEYSDLLVRLKGGEDIPLSQEALHLCIDERLRGNINSIVESFDDLSWDEIESISYQSLTMAEPLEDWPCTLQKDGIMVYHADTPARQAQGLQYIDKSDFPKNAIMLFKNASGPFHMHNCKFPIDIIFTDDEFRVLSVSNMVPEGGYTYSPMGTKHAIETHPEWARKNGIVMGDVLFKDGFGISLKEIDLLELNNECTRSLNGLYKNHHRYAIKHIGIMTSGPHAAKNIVVFPELFGFKKKIANEKDFPEEEELQDPTFFFSDVTDPISVENVVSKLEGGEQQQVKDLMEEYAKRFPELNIQDIKNIFGYWEGEPENSLGVNVSGNLDQIKKLAAYMGNYYNQKSVAIFIPTKEESEGKYLSISFDTPKNPNNLNLLNKLIGHTTEPLDNEKYGIGGASFPYEKGKGIMGMELFLYNDQNNAKVIRQLSTILNEEGIGYEPNMENSQAIFIGDENREKAQEIFRGIVDE